MRPNVSAIIPLHNRPEIIRHAVESVFWQTLPVSELILVDDGSTEDVEGEVRRLVDERRAWKDRVVFVRQENQGQSAALNNGLARAKGDWIAFNAHDDLWLPGKLEWQFRAIDKFKGRCGVCFTDAWFMNNPHMKLNLFEFFKKHYDGPLGIIEDPARLIASNQHPAWVQTCLVRADLIREIGGFDPKLRYSEDHDFLFRLALKTKFCYVSMPMALIDRSPAEIRHTGESENWHQEEFCLKADQYRFEKQLSLSQDLEADVRATIRKNLRSIHSSWANLYLASGDYSKAREALSAAARYDLTANIAFKWILTRISPALAKRVVSMRDRSKPAQRHDRESWKAHVIS
jgi:glycosyltransferase involved in cell wall biosynthesis